MSLSRVFRRYSGFYESYARFELLVSGILLICIAVVILYSTVVLVATLFGEITSGTHFVEAAALRDTFGLILSILILIEFNHSIVLSMRQRVGVLQVRVIITITIIVIARKLILLDYGTATWPTLLGLGGLALALGGLYWILSDIQRHHLAEKLPDD